MLPDRGTLEPNLMSPDSREAAENALARLSETGGPGLIAQDRLARNLLSSQPLCFNLFGHLRSDPNALLPWVRTVQPTASRVRRVELEIAPVTTPLSRSAFDAYVEYDVEGRQRGFLGIECKYAENLSASQRDDAPQKFRSATTSRHWKPGAADALDRPGFRQFWYNALVMFLTLDDGAFYEGTSVVVALDADEKAKEATEVVGRQMVDSSRMWFSSLGEVVEAVHGQEEWKQQFKDRYLNLALSERD
jgi:hypothetical protein